MPSQKKQTPYNALIFLIALVTYNVILFAVFGFDNNAVFWISYGFMLCTFVSWAICGTHLKNRTNQPRDWLFGYPILRHCIFYTVVELIASLVFMILPGNIHIGLPIGVQFIILAVHSIFILSCFKAKETIVEVTENVKKGVTYIDTLLSNIDIASPKAKDAKLKAMISTLREEVRFSDTASYESLASLEAQISKNVYFINEALDVNDDEEAFRCCERALLLMKERNAKAKVL